MPSHLTRRQILASAAATAAVAAMPAVAAIAAVEEAPFDTARFIEVCVAETERLHPGVNPPMAGWAFVVNETTRPLLASLPIDTMATNYVGVLFGLIGASKRASIATGPHRWMPVTIVNGKLRIVGDERGSYRQALIDAGYPLESLS